VRNSDGPRALFWARIEIIPTRGITETSRGGVSHRKEGSGLIGCGIERPRRRWQGVAEEDSRTSENPARDGPPTHGQGTLVDVPNFSVPDGDDGDELLFSPGRRELKLSPLALNNPQMNAKLVRAENDAARRPYTEITGPQLTPRITANSRPSGVALHRRNLRAMARCGWFLGLDGSAPCGFPRVTESVSMLRSRRDGANPARGPRFPVAHSGWRWAARALD
jgi:hypothetical protein